jgi:hypothetical protein
VGSGALWWNGRMLKDRASRALPLVVLAVALLAPLHVAAQRDSEQKFFDQLRNLFGRFREADLRRSFEMARPIQCSELTSDTGEWRPVAFFNEDRKLGDWYYRSLDEVKSELSVFTFKGDCSTDESSVQLFTKFPIKDSLDRYNAGRLDLQDVATKVNPAVTVSFGARSRSYRFELPYLYASLSERNLSPIYTLYPPHAGDRYATNVTNHWDCKSARSNDVTFQFLICETATLPRNMPRGSEADQTFGTYAYFILSDGKEAMTSTKLVFGGGGGNDESKSTSAEVNRAAEPVPASVAADASSREVWQIPGGSTKLVELGRNEFRIRFSSQTWSNKLGSSQILSDQKMSPLNPAKLPAGVDYCVWRPAGANPTSRLMSNEPDADIAYALTATEGNKSSPALVSFEMKTHTGTRIGTLQCAFSGAVSVDSLSVDRWVSIVGGHLTLEINP